MAVLKMDVKDKTHAKVVKMARERKITYKKMLLDAVGVSDD